MPNLGEQAPGDSDLKQENRLLQWQLHEQNQTRFEAIESNQQKQQDLLVEILRNTSDLPELKKKLEKIVDEHNRAKGVAKLAGWLFGGTTLIEGLRFILSRK